MSMRILHRSESNADEGWNTVNQEKYEDEKHLQNLVLKHIQHNPDLIPLRDIKEDKKDIKLIFDEYSPLPVGRPDLLGLDEDGNITIIEVKLQQNPEARRKVVAQILDYAAALWKTTYNELNDYVQDISENNKSLKELMKEQIESDEDDADAPLEDFESNVQSQLDSGNFNLIVVVDEVDDNLKRILEYMNKQPEGPSIYAVAIRYFKDEQNEMIIPQIYTTNQKSEDKKSSTKINRKTFMESIDEHGKDFFREMLDFANEQELPINWGSKGFSLNAVQKDQKISILRGYPPHSNRGQCIRTTFGILYKKLERSLAKELVDICNKHLGEIEGIGHTGGEHDDWHLNIDQNTNSEDNIEIIKECIEESKNKIEGASISL